MNSKNEAYKEWWAQVFDRGSDSYGRVGPDFFSYFGNKLVDHAALIEGSAVLDIACGRGAVLFPACERVCPTGRVVGIDLSSQMVAETQKEIESLGFAPVQVKQMDAEDLKFPAATFDFVLCGFALFFFPNVEKALAEIHRVLKPGGVFCTTTFGDDDNRWNTFDELILTYKDRFKPVPQGDRKSFDNAEEIIETFTNAGFNEIETISAGKEVYYADAEEWWATLWSHGMRALLERMDEATLIEFKGECFEFARGIAGEKGIPQIFQVLITRAVRR